MKIVRLAAACLNQIPMDWDGNSKRILSAIEEAKKQDVHLLCLPELALSGYGCEDQFLSSAVTRESLVQLLIIAKQTSGMIVSAGLPLEVNGVIYNAAALMADGKIIGFYLKQNLARDGLHYEPRWFRAWDENDVSSIELDGQSYPVGDNLFQIDDILIGYEICEDAWVPNRPGRRYAAESVDIILNPSASHFAFGKNKVRENFVTDASRGFNVAYIYANMVGNEAGRILYDGQCLIASNGQILQRGPRFSFKEFLVTSCDVDLELNRLSRRRAGAKHSSQNSHQSIIQSPFSWSPVSKSSYAVNLDEWPKEVEWARAIGLGLFDYMRKTRSRGFVLSLSGGADSTATALMVWIMHQLAIKDLGESGVTERLNYWGLNRPPSMKEILFAVYQKTRNSGPETENAARIIAESIHAEFDVWDVDHLVTEYQKLAESSLKRKLTWDQDDLTLQNIQARVRSPGPWMMANCRSALFLTTSNRSEASVGYATMDGDTSGGLAPLGGTDKAFLLQWLQWMQDQNSSEIPQLPQVKAVNDLEPTAELRPSSQSQKDEHDLMPYQILDLIERWAIRDKRSPVEIYHLALVEFPNYSHADLGNWIIKFFQLWSRNQWKRERLAPNFHVDDENVDPKTWCRFPILNSGFTKELHLLKSIIPSH